VANGRVTVDAIAAGETGPLLKDLERLGTTNTAAAGRIVSGQLPIDQIPAAARLETLRALTPSYARTQATPSPSAPSEAPASRSQSEAVPQPETAPQPDSLPEPDPPSGPDAPSEPDRASEPALRADPTDTPTDSSGTMLFLLGSALTVLFLENH
jgi:hypothetical protein